MSDQVDKKFKPMPLLAAFAKKLEPQVDRVESLTPKAEKLRPYEEHEVDATKHSGLGATIKPTPKKARAKVPENHPERVESLLRQHEKAVAEQREQEDTAEYSGLGTRVKILPRERCFQESKLSHSDDSECGA